MNVSNKQGSVVCNMWDGTMERVAGLRGKPYREMSPGTSARSFSSLLWSGLFYVFSSLPD